MEEKQADGYSHCYAHEGRRNRPAYNTAIRQHIACRELNVRTRVRTSTVYARGVTALQTYLRVTQTAALAEAFDVGVGVGDCVVSRAGNALMIAGLGGGARVGAGLVLRQSLRGSGG